ncbi:uncharacterized protein LOC115626274 isoform X2 [Scaptodrosophila lebanonensis]|uniref:Uncharacterized protein LOC115626274 isoform X2 n=1 Tax=Drosophila lebanonensis TaxID=7225 RepID=A0A6J2TR77_DROLE|nr:uncharacterized protein LOC115626274 isoform X2 [Scaptodrosophila lebanonensis]
MALHTKNLLVASEEGRVHLVKPINAMPSTESIYNENAPRRSVLQSICLLVAFNIVLFSVLILFFSYMGVMDELQRTEIQKYFYACGGVLSLIVLWNIGDLSEGNPHFYYI